jgi:hypothetical protein
MARYWKGKKYRAPVHIVFSGADDNTDIHKLITLSELYPVEYGILAHPDKRRGTTRYPSIGFVREFGRLNYVFRKKINGDTESVEGEHIPDFNLSMHICGGYIDNFEEEGYFGIEDDLCGYDKVQVNVGKPVDEAFVRKLMKWEEFYRVEVILQVTQIPNNNQFVYLFDASRGKGVRGGVDTPWATHPMVLNPHMNYVRPPGYAGGISPDNILDVCTELTPVAQHYGYYLDMESGIRTDNEFDIDKCQQICRLLWGNRQLDTSNYLVYDEDFEDQELPDHIPDNEADFDPRKRY